jgi:hypothetical protein
MESTELKKVIYPDVRYDFNEFISQPGHMKSLFAGWDQNIHALVSTQSQEFGSKRLKRVVRRGERKERVPSL